MIDYYTLVLDYARPVIRIEPVKARHNASYTGVDSYDG